MFDRWSALVGVRLCQSQGLVRAGTKAFTKNEHMNMQQRQIPLNANRVSLINTCRLDFTKLNS